MSEAIEFGRLCESSSIRAENLRIEMKALRSSGDPDYDEVKREHLHERILARAYGRASAALTKG